MQQQQQNIQDPGFAPSFSFYSSNSKTSRAVAKVIREEESARFHEYRDLEEDFEFVLVLNDREITGSLGKLLIGELEDSSSYSSPSEADELGRPRSRTKCKKNSSTVSGAKRWIFRYLIKRSECKGESLKQGRNSGEVTKVGGRWKAQTPVHEQFYVQRRAENEVGKRKSYLPYRKDLVGLFAGKMIPF